LIERKSKTKAYITIDAEKCKGCRYCISVCGFQIIGVTKQLNQIGSIPVEVIPDKACLCSGCGACALMCPETAISIFSIEGESVRS
jgi:2-oxoglutarate ferredoxin oxidoreductase subunit delta